MPFCNQCGSPLDSNSSSSCPVCGRVPSSAPAPASAATPAVPARNRRFVLTFLLGVFTLGAVLLAAAFVVYLHYRPTLEKSRQATVNTPFGKVSAGADPIAVARQIHLPVYPGARASDDSTQFEGMATNVVSLGFVTPDPVRQVLDFYQGQYPSAVTHAEGSDRATLAIVEASRVLNIVANRDGGDTRIQISVVQH